MPSSRPSKTVEMHSSRMMPLLCKLLHVVEGLQDELSIDRRRTTIGHSKKVGRCIWSVDLLLKPHFWKITSCIARFSFRPLRRTWPRQRTAASWGIQATTMGGTRHCVSSSYQLPCGAYHSISTVPRYFPSRVRRLYTSTRETQSPWTLVYRQMALWLALMAIKPCMKTQGAILRRKKRLPACLLLLLHLS